MNFKEKKIGFTLLELTVVIAVLLGLIGILVVGVKAYLQGVEKASCLLNISNIAKEIKAQDLLDGTLPSKITRQAPLTARGIRILLNYDNVICPAQRRLTLANQTQFYPGTFAKINKQKIDSDYFIALTTNGIFRTSGDIADVAAQQGGIVIVRKDKTDIRVACFASVAPVANNTFGPLHHLTGLLVY